MVHHHTQAQTTINIWLRQYNHLRPHQAYVDVRLAMGWSPEQIVGRLKLETEQHTVSQYLLIENK